MTRRHYNKKDMVNLLKVFNVLSDEGCIEMIYTIMDGRNPSIGDFETPKRYYARLSKLKDAYIVKKTGNLYGLTAFGTVVSDIIYKLLLAEKLQWKLKVVDVIGNHVPDKERKQIIESLISDEFVRGILVKPSTTDKVKEIIEQLP